MDTFESRGFFMGVIIALGLGNFIVTGLLLAVVYFLARVSLLSYFLIGAIGLLSGWISVSVMSAFDITGSKKVFGAALVPILVLIWIFVGGMTSGIFTEGMKQVALANSGTVGYMELFPPITGFNVIIISIIYYLTFFLMAAKSLFKENNTRSLFWSPVLILLWFVIYFISRFVVKLVTGGTLR